MRQELYNVKLVNDHIEQRGSIRKLASVTGINPVTIGRMTKGLNVTAATLWMFANGVGVPMCELIGNANCSGKAKSNEKNQPRKAA